MPNTKFHVKQKEESLYYGKTKADFVRWKRKSNFHVSMRTRFSTVTHYEKCQLWILSTSLGGIGREKKAWIYFATGRVTYKNTFPVFNVYIYGLACHNYQTHRACFDAECVSQRQQNNLLLICYSPINWHEPYYGRKMFVGCTKNGAQFFGKWIRVGRSLQQTHYPILYKYKKSTMNQYRTEYFDFVNGTLFTMIMICCGGADWPTWWASWCVSSWHAFSGYLLIQFRWQRASFGEVARFGEHKPWLPLPILTYHFNQQIKRRNSIAAKTTDRKKEM